MNTEENKQIMARNIKRYMESKGVTNQQVCDALGFKYTTFMDWIKAVTYPRIGKVEAMANYFGCEKSDLIEDKKENPTVKDDGISKEKKELIDFIKKLPEDKIQLLLQVARSIR
jgi:transcriptional regulator with XRE-family HTH domain